MPRFTDERQKKAAKNLLRFFVLMLALTLVARGTAGMLLPKVQVASPEPGEIAQEPGAPQVYPSCVPLSALHTSYAGYYVLVLWEQNSVLGLETIAVQIPVAVRAQDGQMAAIAGSVGMRDRIIVSSNKAVQPNDKVRVVP